MRPLAEEPAPHPPDLLVMENFVHAVRDAGYLSLSTALAELVDNSIQAGAHQIRIGIIRSENDPWPEVTVVDDGAGMDETELHNCLRFGGTARFNGRQSFGRFGMGLPMASLSQARRVEVTSWTAESTPRQVILDIDTVTDASTLACCSAELPADGRGQVSGCVVAWRKCDKIEYRRLAWAEKAVHRDLGRMYRRFLTGGVSITVNGTAVQPVDPLMMTDAIEGVRAKPAFETLTYDLQTPGGASTLTVRFSLLPVPSWHRLDNASKKKHGIVGDGGVSILRAGREIARGWYLMGGKRKENYDDWWRCEISFDPDLDEYFGITINKQGIRPTVELREAIEPELESIARILNTRVRKLFEDVKFQEAAQVSCRIANAADSDLPVIHGSTAGPLEYRIGSEPFPDADMFRASLKDRTLSVTLNVDHPAFTALYHPLETMTEHAASTLRTAVELLVLSFARSATVLERAGNQYDDLVTTWSTTYGRMLRKS